MEQPEKHVDAGFGQRLPYYLGFGLVGLVLLFWLASGARGMGEKAMLERFAGEPLPDFNLTDLDDQPVSLSALRGRPVVLAFWAYG